MAWLLHRRCKYGHRQRAVHISQEIHKMAHLTDDPPTAEVNILDPGIRRNPARIHPVDQRHRAVSKLFLDDARERRKPSVVTYHEQRVGDSRLEERFA